jgi:hypothetical protein
MNVEQAWQSVLGQLQMEMPKASFETWVRDTKAVSFQEGVITVSVRNAYARDWLENRITSTVNRLLVGILNMSEVSVKFVVDDGRDDDIAAYEDASRVSPVFNNWRSRSEERKSPKAEDIVEVTLADYDSVYEQAVRPNRAVYLPGYFRRWLRMLGPDLAWLYVGFRQAAYIIGSRTGKTVNRIPGEKVAALAGCTERTYWNRVENKTTWEKLKGLAAVSDDGPQWDSTSSIPKRLPRRYTIAMTLPLTPVDSNSLSMWLASHIEQYGGLEGVLRAAADAPLDELIPLDATEMGEPVTVTKLVQELFAGGELPDNQLDGFASAIQNHIMPQGDLIVVTEYFLKHILPHLGSGPGWMLTILRDICYVDPESGEARNRVTVKSGYAEIAGWMGMSRPRTIWDWLNEKFPQKHAEAGKYKNPVMRVYVSEVIKDATVLDFAGQPRTFDVLIEEIPREFLEIAVKNPNDALFSIAMTRFSNSVDATFSIGVTRLSVSDDALFSIAMTRFSDSIDATFRVLINSLTLKTNSLTPNTTTSNTSQDKGDAPSALAATVEQGEVSLSLPSAWVLDRILIQNRVHPKTQKAVRGASAIALISWLLYALSPQGHGIDKPMSYALARLKDDPQSGAGDDYDKLAKLPPAKLIDATYRASRSQLLREYYRHSDKPDTHAELWMEVMGMNDLSARKLMRYLLGDQSPDIRQKITTSERIEWTEEGVEKTIEESIEEI